MRLSDLPVLLIFAVGAAPLLAADPVVPTEPAQTAPVFTFYLENDFFGGTDRHYTNGVKFAWLSSDYATGGQTGWKENAIEALPLINEAATQKNFGVALGQN